MEDRKQSVRIQTSFLNAAEKKVLVWMAERLPGCITSDMMTFTGTIGAIVIALGYYLCNYNIAWIWLASFGFVVNWLGDSLDGTIARVRKQQRPKYGFFLDHNVDCINEAIMFIGAGLSPLMSLDIALLILAMYLMLSVYVYISAHLKNEFKLTYAKLGPTEFRLIIILVNTAFFFIPALAAFEKTMTVFGSSLVLSALDIVGIIIILILGAAYISSLVKDGREYAKEEPLKK